MKVLPSRKPVRSDGFDALIGLRLSIVRRAADMLVLHFGDVRPYSSGDGNTGAYALHIQGPWRIAGSAGTVTGRSDLWEYAGPGQRPENWSYEDGASLQDRIFDELIGSYDVDTRSWYNESGRLVVTATQQTKSGDLRLELSGGYAILVFPDGSKGEAWRFFSPGAKRHLVFP